MRAKSEFFDEPTDFSLVQGGPLFQLMLRTGLMKPTMDLAMRRILVLCGVAWVPLLVLSAISGQAWGGVEVPFLLDIGAHARLLVSVPLFVAAEVVVHRRIKVTVRQFLDRGLVAPQDQPLFEQAVGLAMRLRNSVVAELVVLGFAVFVGYWVGQRYYVMSVTSWHMVTTEGRTQLTSAGFWYLFVSLTIFRFLMIRWYFRLFVWYLLVWRIARRVPLHLNALHPDQAGGLGFLSISMFAFLPVLVAQTAGLSGILAGKILHEGAALPQFKLEIAAWLLLLLLLVMTPLFFFIFRLGEAKRAGMREYGTLASRYAAEFRAKWIEGSGGKDEPLLGSADIQSLADLGNSFATVRDMRLVPVGRVTVVQLLLLTAMPLLPLTLTIIPLDQLIDRLLGILV